MSLPEPLKTEISPTERKRLQHECNCITREIQRLEAYYAKERNFHHRPKVGRPHPNTWHDPDIEKFVAKDEARLKRMEETAKKVSDLCCTLAALRTVLEKNT